jgi:2Fe-2S ferredoxin
MPKIIFTAHDGTNYEVEADVGQSVMQVATSASVPGILADCGGSGSCATCHCYVDATWEGRIPEPISSEREMLECVVEPRPNSRLSCQVKVTSDMDGLKIQLPESQL